NVTVGGTISGNGSGLTNLNASNLSSGTVPSDRLPSTIGGNKTFSGNVTVGGTLSWGGGDPIASSDDVATIGSLAAVAFSGDYDDLTNVPSTFPPAAHAHSASDITSGTLADARLSDNVPLKNAPNVFTDRQV